MKYFFYILMSLSFVGFGQQNEYQKPVVMSAGATGTVEGVIHSYNIGQTFVSTLVNSTTTVTQGFFQPYILLCDQFGIDQTGTGICGDNPTSLSLSGTSKTYDYMSWFLITESNDTLKVDNSNSTTYNPSFPGNYFLRYTDLICINQTVPVSVQLDASADIPDVTPSGGALSTTATGSYQWYVLIDNIKYAIYGQNAASYSPLFNGEYFLEVTYGATNGCKVMSYETSVSSLGRRISKDNVQFGEDNSVLLSLGAEVSMNLYPYPSSSSFTLEMLSDYTGDISVRLVNLEGKEVSNQSLVKSSAAFRAEVSTLGLTEGLYGVMIYTNSGVHTSKMLIIE